MDPADRLKHYRAMLAELIDSGVASNLMLRLEATVRSLEKELPGPPSDDPLSGVL